MEINNLDLRDCGANKWMLLNNLTVIGIIHPLLNDHYLTVPSGFITDLASIPAWAQSIIQKDDLHKKAAVFHDWLYCLHPCRRKTADEIFLKLMKFLKVPFLKRQTMYWAVRVWGGFVWPKSPKSIYNYKLLLKLKNINYPEFKGI